jgi:predicted nucleic acid-binding protein
MRTAAAVSGTVDTNVLVYRYDPRFPDKQRRAHVLLREGLEASTLVLCHQTIAELYAVLTRPRIDLGGRPLLARADAAQEVEDLLTQFPVAYPDDNVLRLALRGHATYGLSWWEAHVWAYAERYELSPFWTEDFQHGRVYGGVQMLNPFLAEAVQEPRLPWG